MFIREQINISFNQLPRISIIPSYISSLAVQSQGSAFVDRDKWIQSHISLSAALGSIQFSHCNVYLLEGALDP
jgi:hypothetical protein